ncbi:MAG: lamin tail domain-containing protein [Bacteroidota bacterium]
MKKTLRLSLFVGLILLCTQGIVAQTVFINEIHYDNTGSDVNEAVEVAGPAGTSLAGWSLVLYNGSGGIVYNTTSLSGSIDNEGNGYGAVSFAISGIQNGAPDGLALVDNGGTVIQFLSYEGSFTATDGVANGQTSTDIGVSEPGSTPVGESLQLTGTGVTCVGSDFTWTGPTTASMGDLNAGQDFSACGGAAVCNISSIGETNTSVCNDNGTTTDATDDFFTVDLTVNFSNIPATGTLDLTGDVLNTPQSVAVGLLSGSSHTFTGVEFRADGASKSVTATFSADLTCTNTSTVTGVASCSGGGGIAAGDLIFTEVMQNPLAVGDGDGEFFEVHNTTGTLISMVGCIVSDDGTDAFTIAGTLDVPAGGYVVLGLNNNTGTNGNVPVDYVYSGMNLANGADELILTCSGVEIDRVEWDGGPNWPDPNGASMNLNFTGGAYASDNNDGANWCESFTTISGGSDFGTPGAVNDDCASAPGGTCGFTTRGVTTSCDDNGTPALATDDTWTFSLNPQTGTGTYDVTLDNLTGTPAFNGNSYGSSTQIGGSYNIMDGNILVTLSDAGAPCTETFWVYAPGTCSANSLDGTATFYTDAAAVGNSGPANTAVNGLNDNFITQNETNCQSGIFTVVYADLDPAGSSSCTTGSTDMAGVTAALAGTSGQGITVTVTEGSTADDNGDINTNLITSVTDCGTFNGDLVANTTYQAESPASTEIGELRAYYNSAFGAGTGVGIKAALRINFSTAVNSIGFYMGDVESRTDGEDGYPAVLAMFNGSTLVEQMIVPTSTTNQSLCDGDAGSNFDGCGNDETVFFEYFGETPITDIVISVGEVTTNTNLDNTNILSIAGLSCGGTCSTTFPVEWSSFEGTYTGEQVDLVWETASELNNSHFVVERSQDKVAFEAIGEVKAANQDNQSYNFSDLAPVTGTNFYRLTQVDFDGQSSQSDIIQVEVQPIDRFAVWSVYPNPTKSSLRVEANIPLAGEITTKIYASNGQLIKVEKVAKGAGSQLIELGTGSLASGLYLFEMSLNGERVRGKFQKL